MSSQRSTAKKLASNTMYMYIRMIFLLCISLYTSRVVLDKLGVTDFGIYNLVGSILLLLASFQALFISSIQRFLNTEMGRGGKNMNLIFCTSVQNNVILSICYVILIELVGLWFFKYKINIPPDRLFAAHCVFQLSVCSSVIGIMATPYTSLIIAHERMGVYSFLSIIESCLTLMVVFLISIGDFDKLIFYALLVLLVKILMRSLNMIYCKRHFPECKFRRIYDKKIFKEMLSFAGWQFLGNTTCTFTRNFLNMLLNVFGGPLVNAAWGIAHQVDAGLRQFSSNIMFAISPHCMKLFGEGKTNQMNSILYMTSKALFVLQLCLIIPIIFFTQEICSIWLTIVPAHTITFIHLMLIWSLVRSLHGPLDTLFKSHGQIRDYQIAESIILSLPLLFSYLALKLGAIIEVVFVIFIFFEVINFFIILIIAKVKTEMDSMLYLRTVVLPCAVCSILPLFLIYIKLSSTVSLTTSFLFVIGSIVSTLFLMFLLGLSKKERKKMANIICNFIHNHNKKM